MKKQSIGFTLVELIIVISIISVLATLAFMSFSTETASARDAKRDGDLRTYENVIATSSSQNKRIRYTEDAADTGRDGSGDQGARESISTNNGTITPLRGSYLMPIQSGVFESDVIATAERDPKGSPYFGVFISDKTYQLFGTKENPDTQTPAAFVTGSFKEGALVDVLRSDVDSSATVIPVSNPIQFIAGDIISIDDEEMTVVTFNNVVGDGGHKTVTVTRASNGTTAVLHNKEIKIKLKTSRAGGTSLLCLGQLQTAAGTPVDTTVTAAFVASSDIMHGTASVGILCSTATGNGTVIDEGLLLPYKVN
ncbi:hypothetical protein COB57_02530 [Candidatus Peregrinibacteria bacterium]|nr:MAG: hypothetical protein COB57_02530 [Candidatus Peregrinibacteria bacterium]